MGKNRSGEESNKDQNLPTSSTLRQAIVLVTSLISLTHSIRVFAGKWQTIRTKLEELHSGLASIEDSCSGGDSPISDSIPVIIDAVNDCHDLARRCLEVSYSGKLLMKSDLDIISAKFDTHIKNLTDVYTAGLLRDNNAIIVPKPGVGATRDDMRFYVNDLMSRLKIGSTELKKQALISLIEVVNEDERYIKVVLETGSLIGLLVKFLDSKETDLQEEAAVAISVIAGLESSKSVLVVSGVISPLIRVLESGSERGREMSTRCLMKLTENSENVWSVSAHGGVTSLLKICTSVCDYGGELVSLACGVLKNLVGVEEIKRFMIEEGAISACIMLLSAKDESTQISSIQLLQTMAFGDDAVRKMIIKEGGIRELVRVLDPKSSSYSTKTREIAIRTIVNICFPSMATFDLLMRSGFTDHVLYYLRQGEHSLQELALKAAYWLCGISEEAKKAMGEAGFMPELVKLLGAKPFEAREMAAETLSSMVSVPRNRKQFARNEQNVGLLLQLLDFEQGNSSTRKSLLSILMSLTSCHSARKKISHSGHLRNIERLAEAEVSDAKKILRRLSSNRFRSMLSGFWHS